MEMYVLQDTSCVNKKVGIIFKDGASPQILDLQLPHGLGLRPSRPDDLMRSLDKGPQLLVVTYLAKVVLNLCRGGKEARPGRIWSPAELVVVARHVTLAPGVPVLEPGTPDILVLLVDHKLVRRGTEGVSQGAYQVDPACTGADPDNANGLRSPERRFLHGVGGIGAGRMTGPATLGVDMTR